MAKGSKERQKGVRKISIVVPAHDEEKNIKKTVTEIADGFRNAQIIVVCNGCTDRTYELARHVKRPNVKVVNFYGSIGKGGAILEGFKLASGDIVGFVDADGSFRVEDIGKAVKGLEKYDAVIGSKWKGRGFFEVQSDFMRKIGSRGWKFLVGLLTDLEFEDTQAGLKFFRRPVIDSILKSSFMCRGFDFDVELLCKVKKGGFKIKEFYVPIEDGGKSTFDAGNMPKMFGNLLKFHFSKDKE